MSNQIVISSGAKVRSLEGVLTGTAGIVNSVPLGGANGVATLDSNGKVPLSQLPASVVTYLGTWNAATNTPTLTNGVGDVGDLYICNVAGTVNFGAGPITFAVGDWVIYNGSQWQKSAGSSGTVTSVAVTESGDALTITGSPITTAGTINIGFAGTSTQYIAGNGTLVTFPSIISEAQNLVTEVYNNSGATIAKGSVVYINGGQGNLPTITKAQADTEVASNQTIGLVRADITNMNNGYVTVAGRLENLDTQAYSVGTTLYLSPSVAGAYTSTKPTSPDHIVYVGVVVRAHPTQGVIEVKIQNTQELSESSDVLITSPANNEGLFYDGTSSLWKNKTIANVLGYTPADAALVVPYTGATTNVDLGSRDLLTRRLYLNTNNQGIYARDSAGTNLYQIFALNSSDKVSIDQTGLGTVFGGNVDLGSYDLTGNYINGKQLTVNKNGTTGGALFIESGSAGFGFGGTSGIAIASGSTNNLTLAFTDATATNTKAAILNFGSLTNNTNRTYTLPDISGTLALTSNLSAYVPYTGATTNVDLGINSLATTGSISANNGTFIGAGSLAGQVILKWGSGFNSIASYSGIGGISGGFYLNTNIAGATKVALFDLSGLTNSTQRTFTFPDASGTIALTSQLTNGTVTSVTVGTGEAGTNVSANVATSTTTPVITINIPIASATNTGKLSNTDWTTFNNKQNALTNPVTGTGTTNYLPKFTGASSLGNSLIFDNGTNVGIGNTNTTYTFDVTGTGRFTSTLLANGISSIGQEQAFTFQRTTGTASDLYSINADSGSAYLYNNTTSKALMTWLEGGNVGIGTSNPQMPLSVQANTGNGAIRLIGTSNGGTNNAGIYWYDSNDSTFNGYLGNFSSSFDIYNQRSTPMAFFTAGTERMRISSDGSIGFNISTLGSRSFSFQGISGRPLVIEAIENAGVHSIMMRPNNSGYNLISSNYLSGGTYLPLSLSGRENTSDFVLTNTGLVLIGTTSSPSAYGKVSIRGTNQGLTIQDAVSNGYRAIYFQSGNLYFYNGTNEGYLSSGGTWVNASDITLKKDVKEIEYGLKEVMELKPKWYRMIEDDLEQIGFIAQDVEEVLPELVSTSEKGMKGLSYGQLTAVLVKAIQELSAKVSALENKS